MQFLFLPSIIYSHNHLVQENKCFIIVIYKQNNELCKSWALWKHHHYQMKQKSY